MSSPIDKNHTTTTVGSESLKQEGFVTYFGRTIFHWIGQFISHIGSLINKVKNVAASVFFHQQPEPSSSNTSTSLRSSSVSISESSTDSDSDSESESPEAHHAFSSWKEYDWELVIKVLGTMLTHWSEKPELSESFSQGFDKEIEHFGKFKEKLERVWVRLPDAQKNVLCVKEFFNVYQKLVDEPASRLMILYNTLFKRSSPITKSPRILLGGIPQVENSCYLNAVVQVINPNYLNPVKTPKDMGDKVFEDETNLQEVSKKIYSLNRQIKAMNEGSDEKKTIEEERDALKIKKKRLRHSKKVELDRALRLLMRLKDDPDADADEVWFAALILRNLLYDTGIIKDLKLDRGLGYFRMQDAAVCISGLLEAYKIEIHTVLNIEGVKEPVYDPNCKEIGSLIKLPIVNNDFQKSVNQKFSPVKGEKRGLLSFQSREGQSFRWEICDEEKVQEVKIFPGDTPYTTQPIVQLPTDKEGQSILPKFLCFHLGRFDDNGSKIKSRVQFPKNGVVDLSKAFDHRVGKPVYYKLTGVVLHLGGEVNTGHYVACATRDRGESWREYNDDLVGQEVRGENEIPPEFLDKIERDGYLFYLEKVESDLDQKDLKDSSDSTESTQSTESSEFLESDDSIEIIDLHPTESSEDSSEDLET